MNKSDKINKRKLIIGIDPGIWCGIAAIDFDANLVFFDCKRGFTINEIIQKISSVGTPEIVASDVRPAPHFAKKLASKLNVSVYVPKVLLGSHKKRELVQKYLSDQGIDPKNPHIYDALAAALKAFNYYKNKFMRINSIKSNYQIDINELKNYLIKGIKIKEAISKSFINKEKIVTKKYVKVLNNEKKTNEKIIELFDEIKKLTAENEKLRKEIRNLKSEILILNEVQKKKNREFEIEVRKDRIIQLQKREIEDLVLRQRKLSNIKNSKKIRNRYKTIKDLADKGRIIILKPLKKFTFKFVGDAVKNSVIKEGDIPVLLDASCGGRSTAQNLIKANIKAIIACTPMSHQAEEEFLKYEVPVLNSAQIKIEWMGDIPYIKTKAMKEITRAVSELSSKSKLDLESILLSSKE